MNQKVLDFVLETIATIFAALCAFHLSAQLPFLIEFPIIFLPLLAIPALMLLTLGYLLPWSIFAALPIGAVMLFQNPWTLRFILPALLLISAGVAFRYLKQLRRIPVCLAAAVAASLAGVFWDAGLRFWNHAPQQHELRAVSRTMILSLSSPATNDDELPTIFVVTDNPILFQKGFGRMTLLPPDAEMPPLDEEDKPHLILLDFHRRKTLNDHALFLPEALEARGARLRKNGVLAMRLPESKEAVAILASARKAFRYVAVMPLDGGFQMLCSNGPDRPTTDPELLNEKAERLGLYRTARFPSDLVSIMLNLDADKEFPDDWMNESFQMKQEPGSATPLAFFEADGDPRLHAESILFRRFGVWIFALAAVLWLFARYFVSWKTFHKQVFRSFENLFFLAGVLTLAAFLAGRLVLFENAPPFLGTKPAPWMAAALCVFVLLLKRSPERRLTPLRRLVPVAVVAIGLSLLFFPLDPSFLLAALAILIVFLGETVRGACAEPAALYLPVNAGGLFGAMIGIAFFPIFAMTPHGLAVWAGILILMRVLRCFA